MAPASKAGLLPPTMTKVRTHHGRGRKPPGVYAPVLFENVGDCKSANVHIYETNLEATKRLLQGDEEVKFVLNV